MRGTWSLPCRAPRWLVALSEQSVSFGPTEAGGHKGHLSSHLTIYPQVTACSGEGFKGDYSANIQLLHGYSPSTCWAILGTKNTQTWSLALRGSQPDVLADIEPLQHRSCGSSEKAS